MNFTTIGTLKRKKTKKRPKNKKQCKPSTSGACNLGASFNRPSKRSNLVCFEETLSFESKEIKLTPSKSEYNNHKMDTEVENDHPPTLSEASFVVSSDEEDFHYFNVTDEFVFSHEDSDVKIVSPGKSVTKGHKCIGKSENCFMSIIDQVPVTEETSTLAVTKGQKRNRENGTSSPNSVLPLRKVKIIEEKQAVVLGLNKLTEESTKKNTSDSSISDYLCKQNVQHYHTNDGIIVVLNEDERVYFYGLTTVSILHGSIEVFGHVLTKESAEVNLYSMRGTSLLYLKNVTNTNCSVPSPLLLSSIVETVKLSPKCAIIFCKKLLDPNILFVEKHVSQQILLKDEGSSLPRINLHPKGRWNLLQLNQKWNKIIDATNQFTRIMICGGKGVGKTTFLRYAINRLLLKFPEVRVIDLDPGQSEFTVPGCISIIRVNRPLFGPNYTHLMDSERSILSNINVSYEPNLYIESVKCLLNSNFAPVPTLVNYMGYTHGIGINIISAVITYVNPTDVIQIHSENFKKNYKCLLSPDIVLENSKLLRGVSQINLSYNLVQIESMCDESDGWTAEPRQLREMCILAYVNSMFDVQSVFKPKAPMYKISLSDVKIVDLQGEVIHPMAINACLVALCSLEENSPAIFKCYGWGIVKGIEVISNELILLSREKVDTLDKVHYLVSSGVSLPPSVYMTPDELTGPMPFVMEGILTSFGQIPKRS